MNDPASEVAIAAKGDGTFRLLEKLGTDPKVIYRSARPWVRQTAEGALPRGGKEEHRG
jgi:hypothetical protein